MLEVTPRRVVGAAGAKRRDEGRRRQVVCVFDRGPAGEVAVDGVHMAVEEATEPSRITE